MRAFFRFVVGPDRVEVVERFRHFTPLGKRQDDVGGLLVFIDDETRVNGVHGRFWKNAV